MRATAVALAVLAGAAAAVPAAAFDPTGEVVFRISGGAASGASFDAERVVGPAVNVAIADDGGWTGDVAGEDVSLEVTDTKITGANVNLTVSSKGDATTIEGLFFGRRVRVTVDGRKLDGRLGACSFEMKRKKPGLYSGDVGCVARGATFPSTAWATMTLTGEASGTPPREPQFALALLGVLPG